MAAAHPGAAVAADGVDLVDEDDARRVLLGLLEQVAHAARADAHEHLHEVRARDREERHPRLARHRPRQQRLARARRPVEQNPLRDPRPQRLELLRVLQKLLDLVQLLDRLVGARDVAEADLRCVGRHPLGARLAERHHLRAAGLHAPDEEDPQADEEQERQRVGEDRDERVAARVLDVERHLVAAEVLHQLGAVVLGVADLVVAPRLRLDLDGVVARLDRRALHLAVVDLGEELGEGDRLPVLAPAEQRRQQQRQQQHHEDDGDRGAGALHWLNILSTDGKDHAKPVTQVGRDHAGAGPLPGRRSARRSSRARRSAPSRPSSSRRA